MKNYDKKQALEIIVKAAHTYEERLNNRHFMIVYYDNKQIQSCTVGFRNLNFLHLTGVKARIPAQQFYNACLSNKLSINDFELDHKGKVQQKLAVLPYLPELLYNNCMIGNFINNGVMIRADYFVGDTRAVISVGFRYGKSADYPVTLYNESIKKLTLPTCKILAIFRKTYRDEIYNEYTYLSSGFDILQLPDELKEKLNPLMV